MSAQPRDEFDASFILGQIQDPSFWRLLSPFPPPSARRILHAVLQEITNLVLSPEAKERRDGQILENARRLGIPLPAGKARAFLARHHGLQALRQAEELLCTQGDVEAQVRWAEESFVVRGLSHAKNVAKAGSGAVVVGAHLGPLVYYIPMLVYYLSKAGLSPEILAVMNEPAPEHGELIRRQVERFAPHHASRFGLLAKAPGGELQLWRDLEAALSRHAWILMQIDAVTGGRNPKPLRFAGREIALPGVWGAVRLAARCGVPVLPAMVWRTRRDGLGLQVLPALEVSTDQGPRGSGVAEAAQQLAGILEKWVFRDPADWGQLPNFHLLFQSGT